MKEEGFASACLVPFSKLRFQLNTAMGCCFAPAQREIRQRVLSAGDKPSYQSVPMRIKTNQTVFLSRILARPTTSAGTAAILK